MSSGKVPAAFPPITDSTRPSYNAFEMSSEPLLPAGGSAPAQPRLPHANGSSADAAASRRLIAAKLNTVVWALGPWVIGTVLALTLPSGDSALPPGVHLASRLLGYVYVVAWSVSFYPQLWLNWRRKSVVGLSLDFQLLNMLGFTCYAVYNTALVFNSAVRKQYAALHPGQQPAVHANDVFFAVHAAAATALTLVQCCVYDRGGQRPAAASVAATAVLTAVAACWAVAVAVVPAVNPGACPESCPPQSLLTWLSWLYFLGYIKMGVSLVKYCPQVVLNYRRRSTEGWHVWNVLLDFEGGVLSLGQLLMDAAACTDWSAITGNPVKFGLSFTSMFFDVIFMAQHYCLYPASSRAAALEAMQDDLEKADWSSSTAAGAGGQISAPERGGNLQSAAGASGAADVPPEESERQALMGGTSPSQSGS